MEFFSPNLEIREFRDGSHFTTQFNELFESELGNPKARDFGVSYKEILFGYLKKKGFGMVVVRKAELKDISGIITVCSQGWRETYKDLVPEEYIDQVIVDFYNEERVAKECSESTPDYHGYWVAEQAGQIVGCIGGGIDDKNTGHVYVFYVRPDVKRRGIGTALLETFTSYQIETYGIKEQCITSLMEGNLIGKAFYEKAGFALDFISESSYQPGLRKSLHLKRLI